MRFHLGTERARGSRGRRIHTRLDSGATSLGGSASSTSSLLLLLFTLFSILINLFDPTFPAIVPFCGGLGSLAIPSMERWTELLRIAARSADRMLPDMARDPRIRDTTGRTAAHGREIRAVDSRPCERIARSLPLVLDRLSSLRRASIVSACASLELALPMHHRFPSGSRPYRLGGDIVVVPLLSLVCCHGGFAAILYRLALPGSGRRLWVLLHRAELVAAWHMHRNPRGVSPQYLLPLHSRYNWASIVGIADRIAHKIQVNACSRFALRRDVRHHCRPALETAIESGWSGRLQTSMSARATASWSCFRMVETMFVDGGGGFPGMTGFHASQARNLDIR